MASARENGHVLMKYVRGEYKSARCHPRLKVMDSASQGITEPTNAH